MKSAPFKYHVPSEIDEALELLYQLGDEAKVLAGGQSLVPMLNYRLLSPANLLDINRVSELKRYSLTDEGLKIGAGVRQREIELSPEIELAFPVLHQALTNVAHVQIRNRGTICGSLAHADSAAELPSVMVALDAQMVIRSGAGDRTVKAEEFFRFHLTSDLEPAEILTEVHVPKLPANTVGAFEEVTRRKGDFALVGAALVGQWDANGQIQNCRIVCSGVAPVPLRLRFAEDIVNGTDLSDQVLVNVQQSVMDSLDPTEDIHTSSHYRKIVTGVVVRRGLSRLVDQRGAVNVSR